MVSPINEPMDDMRGAPAVEYLVEQFYPEEIAKYNDEVDERLRALALWIREHPWQALGVAATAGFVVSLATRPAFRLVGRALKGICGGQKETAEQPQEEGV